MKEWREEKEGEVRRQEERRKGGRAGHHAAVDAVEAKCDGRIGRRSHARARLTRRNIERKRKIDRWIDR